MSISPHFPPTPPACRRPTFFCPRAGWDKNWTLPRTRARSSVFESDWDFGSALGIMGKAKRKSAWQITISKWRKVIYAKLKGKKESFRVFFSEGKVQQPVLKDKIPCPHSSYVKDPHFFERNGISQHFRVVRKCTFMDVNLQESLALRRRLHAKEITLFGKWHRMFGEISIKSAIICKDKCQNKS